MHLSRWALPLAGLVVMGALGHHYYTAGQQAARIFGNATYVMWDGYRAQAVTLVDGVHDEPYLYVRYDDRYVYGDFNGDGVRDAAVIVVENNGGTAAWYTLAFLIGEKGGFIHRASRVLDDRAIINALREKEGKVLVNMFVHQEGDCRAGPTKRVRNLYTYDGPDPWTEVLESPYQRIYTDGSRAFEEIYSTAIPAQIRDTFDRTLPFAKKFILVDVGPDEEGYLSATLVFEGTSVPYSLQMDDKGDGKYGLRRMTELVGLFGDGFMRQLQKPAYRHYWL